MDKAQSDLSTKILSASKLIDTAHGIWRAQILSSAVEFGLFDYLETEANRGKTEQEICEALSIKALRSEDFLNSLVGMGHIEKE